jgi:carboxypeptidase Taq
VSYVALAEHYRRLSQLRHVEAITSWDESTMMPTGGGPARAEALSVLRGLIHQHATCEGLADLLAAAKAESANLPPWQQANLREMTREWVRASALPQKLVEAMSQAESLSEQAWRKLRPDNDFAGFLPFFREVVQLKREAAQAWAEKLSLSPYDALMDGFEPGARTNEIAPLFARLRAFLPGFIAKALERQAGEPALASEGQFPVESQRELGLELMRRLGFDFNHGRLDTSHHPFCGGVPTDVRITTRYSTSDYSKSMMSVLHESGHAKYEQNLPRSWLGQPVGLARGMSIHESQSLLTEMQVCRGRAFLEFAAPFIAQAFPDHAKRTPDAFTPENLFRGLARVKPGLIRVDADEATYPCHIILRFELEQRLVDGSLRPEDVPEAWNTGIREVLGLSTRGNDRDGCMQDVHWPAGLIGYFPSYTLGALTAAQLFRAARRALPELTDQIRRGELGALDAWLREKVWSQGSLLGTTELVERATGSVLTTEAFEQHLEYRYLQRESS